MSPPLAIVLRCEERALARVRYVFDSLLCACGVPVKYEPDAPTDGPWLFYGESTNGLTGRERCIAIPYASAGWDFFLGDRDIEATDSSEGMVVAVPQSRVFDQTWDFGFDIVVNAFYFLASWSERSGGRSDVVRGLYEDSVFRRLAIPQDVVDHYLEQLRLRLAALCERLGRGDWTTRQWPGGSRYAIVLSHDVDFLPTGVLDIVAQGARTMLRHLVRQRDPVDAFRSAVGLTRALLTGRDPYGCVPEIIAREKELGVRASFQVAVGHRHREDVNYYVEDERTRAYLRTILEEDFELCLHGSYRSTEEPGWYEAEVETLAKHLERPIGSRQHFLAFNYDSLFHAQERAGILYDMSMGYPDRIGPRAGFSYPYFPYCIEEDRPYRVLQVSLCMMDVTLRSYMGLKGEAANQAISSELRRLRSKGGCVSVVWHPIVFGGARDPGDDQLFWKMVEEIGQTDGVATDGRTINALWRNYAADYPSFSRK